MKTNTVKFCTDKAGRRFALRWSVPAARWIRIGLEAAELLVATGKAVGRFEGEPSETWDYRNRPA